MKIAIAGSSGFIGQHLTQYFLERKYSLILISRKKLTSTNPLIRHATWSELKNDIKVMTGTDVIVNLAGESINQRWTDEAKERILNSRLDAVAQIANIVERMEQKPSVVINASGVSIYGTSERGSFVEHSDPNVEDFLSGVVEKWEAAMDEIRNTRIVKLRLGIVLGLDGGAFPKLLTPYKLGIGGRVGSGKQIISWIHIDDLCRLIDFCIENEDIIEQINATSPQAVTNDEMGKAIAKALRTRHWFPVPAFMMKLMFGEMSVLLLKGQRAIPLLAIDYDFSYLYPTIDMACANLLKKQS
ncbi:TIGR01777 family oxidoreductase [Paenibacillus sp. FSL H7-0331]|uniref:TIGR01777 family oxidoreductase n=1 Tax=Paenibacillus sp. FSL H7-0331 TaxID=1920421 RepID=UPI00096E27B3|nr:TIGR01777 family oxidoreductase [Paenibacillus sp. FSL H7-0331]OMF19937.1 TIGR01777 family protein [Paenibacillus sp. FSL H7-0331]